MVRLDVVIVLPELRLLSVAAVSGLPTIALVSTLFAPAIFSNAKLSSGIEPNPRLIFGLSSSSSLSSSSLSSSLDSSDCSSSSLGMIPIFFNVPTNQGSGGVGTKGKGLGLGTKGKGLGLGVGTKGKGLGLGLGTKGKGLGLGLGTKGKGENGVVVEGLEVLLEGYVRG